MASARHAHKRPRTSPDADSPPSWPLPPELLKEVLSHLTPDDAARVMRVSRQWQAAAAELDAWQQTTIELGCKAPHLPRYAVKVAVACPAVVTVLALMARRSCVFEHLHELDISRQSFNATGMQLLASKAPNLQVLNLSFNRGLNKGGLICLAGLKKFKSLYIDGAELAGEAVMQLASLTQLRQLHASHNALQGDDSQHQLTCFTQLTSLQLDLCKLTNTGVEQIGKLTQLCDLSLSCSRVSNEQIQHVARLTQLTRLDLGFNLLRKGESVHLLTSLSELRWLNLAKNYMDDRVGRSLGELSRLTYLELSFNDVGAVAMGKMTGLTNLEVLKVQGCYLTADAGVYLACFARLRVLDMGMNKFTGAGLPHLAGLTDLCELRIGNNELEDSGCLQHLANLTKLHTLDIRRNSLDLAHALAHLTGLTNMQTLEVSHNASSTAGALRPAASFAKLQSLRAVENGLVSEELQYLVGLPLLSSLEIVDNKLGPEAVHDLLQLTALTHLDVSYNSIGEHAVNRLLLCMPWLSTLKHKKCSDATHNMVQGSGWVIA